MIAYRCYLLGEDGKIKGAEIIECATDAAALDEAERRLAADEYPAIEVWDMARRVGLVGCSQARSQNTASSRERSPVLSA